MFTSVKETALYYVSHFIKPVVVVAVSESIVVLLLLRTSKERCRLDHFHNVTKLITDADGPHETVVTTDDV